MWTWSLRLMSPKACWRKTLLNRLEKAKRLVSETINKLSGDRVGIIAYAASAIPQLPITTDYGLPNSLGPIRTCCHRKELPLQKPLSYQRPILTMRTDQSGLGDSQRQGRIMRKADKWQQPQQQQRALPFLQLPWEQKKEM